MDARQALTGALPFAIVLAALLSVPVCAGLLWLYRRAVLRGMSQQAGPFMAPVDTPAAVGKPPPALQVEQLAAAPDADSAAWRHTRRAPWQSAGIYLVAGTVYAVLM
ncbi:MAG: hypothetical protein Q8M96_05670, partial [Rubrivivax sp.]|nr:hypothetical protein [Rubrivivax sp.]